MRLSLFLYQAGHTVSVVNPARVVAFRLWEGGRTKTDKQDAKLIAHLCVQKRPVAWLPTPEELEQLQVLLVRLEALQVMERQEAKRLENSRLDAQTRQEIEAHRQDLQAHVKGVKKRLHAHVEQHETLKEHCALLISLPGIAELSAARRLSEIVDSKRFKTVKQLVAHAGLAPGERSSGTSVHGKAFIGKAGRSRLRKSLYMCAVVASTHDPAIRAYAQNLRERRQTSQGGSDGGDAHIAPHGLRHLKNRGSLRYARKPSSRRLSRLVRDGSGHMTMEPERSSLVSLAQQKHLLFFV